MMTIKELQEKVRELELWREDIHSWQRGHREWNSKTVGEVEQLNEQVERLEERTRLNREDMRDVINEIRNRLTSLEQPKQDKVKRLEGELSSYVARGDRQSIELNKHADRLTSIEEKAEVHRSAHLESAVRALEQPKQDDEEPEEIEYKIVACDPNPNRLRKRFFYLVKDRPNPKPNDDRAEIVQRARTALSGPSHATGCVLLSPIDLEIVGKALDIAEDARSRQTKGASDDIEIKRISVLPADEKS